MPDNELCAAFGLARPTRARLHRGVHRGAAELGSCRQRLGDGLLLGVVRCGSFVRVTCKYPAVGRGYDRTDAVGRRAGGTFAAFVDRHPQVAQVFFRRVGMQRVGRHLHAVDLLAGVRDALGRRCAEPCPAPATEPQPRVDGQPQCVGHPFVEEHAQHPRPALDHQVFDAALFEFGDDVFGGNCFAG